MEHPSGDVRLWVGVLQLATENSQHIFIGCFLVAIFGGYFCWPPKTANKNSHQKLTTKIANKNILPASSWCTAEGYFGTRSFRYSRLREDENSLPANASHLV